MEARAAILQSVESVNGFSSMRGIGAAFRADGEQQRSNGGRMAEEGRREGQF